MTQRMLDEAEVRARLARELPRWTVEGGALVRRYRTTGWRGSMLVAGAVGHLAEAAWHHPDLLVRWGGVEVRLWTHDAGGITAKDLALARRIEEVVAWRPAGADGLEGPPEEARLLQAEA
jgi:4a-hydroxytetrahydrobiopterin dehydratase